MWPNLVHSNLTSLNPTYPDTYEPNIGTLPQYFFLGLGFIISTFFRFRIHHPQTSLQPRRHLHAAREGVPDESGLWGGGRQSAQHFIRERNMQCCYHQPPLHSLIDADATPSEPWGSVDTTILLAYRCLASFLAASSSCFSNSFARSRWEHALPSKLCTRQLLPDGWRGIQHCICRLPSKQEQGRDVNAEL